MSLHNRLANLQALIKSVGLRENEPKTIKLTGRDELSSLHVPMFERNNSSIYKAQH